MQGGENDNIDTRYDENVSRRTIANTNKPFYRLLIVDDDNEILITMKQILEDKGFLVYPFSNPLEALSAFNPGLYWFAFNWCKNATDEWIWILPTNKKEKQKYRHKNLLYYRIWYLLWVIKKDFPGLNVGCFIQKPVKAEELANKINEELQ